MTVNRYNGNSIHNISILLDTVASNPFSHPKVISSQMLTLINNTSNKQRKYPYNRHQRHHSYSYRRHQPYSRGQSRNQSRKRLAIPPLPNISDLPPIGSTYSNCSSTHSANQSLFISNLNKNEQALAETIFCYSTNGNISNDLKQFTKAQIKPLWDMLEMQQNENVNFDSTYRKLLSLSIIIKSSSTNYYRLHKEKMIGNIRTKYNKPDLSLITIASQHRIFPTANNLCAHIRVLNVKSMGFAENEIKEALDDIGWGNLNQIIQYLTDNKTDSKKKKKRKPSICSAFTNLHFDAKNESAEENINQNELKCPHCESAEIVFAVIA